MTHIGLKIKKRREELELTQEELAHRLGYKSKSTINKIEMGINDISQSKIVLFADALNTTPAYLMGWTSNPEPSTIKGKITPKEKENAVYYMNEETAKTAQKIFENQELRMLFDAVEDAEPEDLMALHNMALALKRKERGNIDDTGC